jgi:tRNA pseudouridine38-40 synthase
MIVLNGSGRTDAGVHSEGQVATAEVSKIIIPETKLATALNAALPNDIKILKAIYIDKQFHARFDALEREYKYKLAKKVNVFERNFVTEIKLPFDISKLYEIADIFLGSHNFTSLSKVNPDIRNNNCIVTESRWEKAENDIHTFYFRANHFLYGMVRATVGIMLDYARGKKTREDIHKALEFEDRQLASAFVPPTGLFLSKVFYPKEIEKQIYG